MKVQELLELDYLNIQEVSQLKQIIETYQGHLDAMYGSYNSELNKFMSSATSEIETKLRVRPLFRK